MKNLKLSLKKEIISNLEANDIKGGGWIISANKTYCESSDTECKTFSNGPSCYNNNCLHTAEATCFPCE